MAVVGWTVVSTAIDGSNFKLVKWVGLRGVEPGQPFVVAQFNDKTVQVVKAKGSGITIQGSLDPDGSAWDTLNDAEGHPLSGITRNLTVNVLERPYLIRPSGEGDVWLLLAAAR
jgi:hypothetical protein